MIKSSHGMSFGVVTHRKETTDMLPQHVHLLNITTCSTSDD